jgi:hypothetical protein
MLSYAVERTENYYTYDAAKLLHQTKHKNQ